MVAFPYHHYLITWNLVQHSTHSGWLTYQTHLHLNNSTTLQLYNSTSLVFRKVLTQLDADLTLIVGQLFLQVEGPATYQTYQLSWKLKVGILAIIAVALNMFPCRWHFALFYRFHATIMHTVEETNQILNAGRLCKCQELGHLNLMTNDMKSVCRQTTEEWWAALKNSSTWTF